VVIGHVVKGNLVIDTKVTRPIGVNTEHVLGVSVKGTTVSVSLDGQAVLGYVFNAAAVDGQSGLVTSGGAATFDNVTVKTDDPAFVTQATAGFTASLAGVSAASVAGGSPTKASSDASSSVLAATTAGGPGDDALLAALDEDTLNGGMRRGLQGDRAWTNALIESLSVAATRAAVSSAVPGGPVIDWTGDAGLALSPSVASARQPWVRDWLENLAVAEPQAPMLTIDLEASVSARG
jgi:hypothetical protein